MIGTGTNTSGQSSVVWMLCRHARGSFGGEGVDFAGGQVGIGSVEDGGGKSWEGEVGGGEVGGEGLESL